jgi:stress response protein SCP2
MSEAMQIARGQRVKLADLGAGNGDLTIGLSLSAPGLACDFACFGLDAQGVLSDERYMSFFNQPRTPCGGVTLAPPAGDQAGFALALQSLPAAIQRLVITAAIDGPGAMSSLREGHVRMLAGGVETARFAFTGADFQAERALMLVEVYRKDGAWRLMAVGQGFNGGLEALVKHFGGTVAAPPPAPAASPPPAAASPASSRLSLEKKFEGQPQHLVDLAKKAAVSLEKKQLGAVQAQVCLILDASGSMTAQYRNGRVQEVLERLVPLAVHFDPDGIFECWIFADQCKPLPAVSLSNIQDYIKREASWASGIFARRPIGGGNNEPCVIQEVMDRFRAAQHPAYIIFISDGGIYKNREIERLIIEAARLPIFWQFVGIGGGNYGVLEKLDDMSGRVVDNCNFFALDDLHSVSEEELYERMLEEFPAWLRAARDKQILS